jgi:hypothetical protein
MNTTYTAEEIIALNFPAAPKVMSFKDIIQLVQTHELVVQSRAGLVKIRRAFIESTADWLTLEDQNGKHILTITEEGVFILYDKHITLWTYGKLVDTIMVLQPRVPKHTLADDVRAALMSVGEELGLPNNVASALAMKAYLKVAESPFTVSTPVDN